MHKIPIVLNIGFVSFRFFSFLFVSRRLHIFNSTSSLSSFGNLPTFSTSPWRAQLSLFSSLSLSLSCLTRSDLSGSDQLADPWDRLRRRLGPEMSEVASRQRHHSSSHTKSSHFFTHKQHRFLFTSLSLASYCSYNRFTTSYN